MIKKLHILLLLLIASISVSKAQVDGVNFLLKYDTSGCNYACYIIIKTGNLPAPTLSDLIQYNSNYTLAVSKGTLISVNKSFNPKTNINVPGEWVPSNSTKLCPDWDYYSFIPTLSPATFFEPSLNVGDTVKLFSLKITSILNCGVNVRLFDNTIDPPSTDPCLQGGDYSNGYTIGNPNQIYLNNEKTVLPPRPIVEATQICKAGLNLDLKLKDSTKCVAPLTYSWAGPGYTGTNQDVIIPPGSNPVGGNYTVTITDANGCKDTLSVIADPTPFAGADLTACGGSSITLQGQTPNTGTWTSSDKNIVGATLTPGSNGTANVAFDANVIGDFDFIYTFNACSDTIKVTVASQDAGLDPTGQDCYDGAVIGLSAISNTGMWVFKSGPGAVPVILNPNNKNTTVSGFTLPGTFVFSWVNGLCSDDVTFTLDDICLCPIMNNVLTIPAVSDFCVSSSLLTIIGSTPTPANGTYLWEYNNGSGWLPAPPNNTNKDYTLPTALGVGTHIFRRIYTITTPACNEISNEITINVYPNPDAGPNQVDACAVLKGGEVTMAATGVGTWTLKTPAIGDAFIDADNLPNTVINQFTKAGVYTFVWTDNNNCKDEADVTITARSDAGIDKELPCSEPSSRTVTMNATGPGQWVRDALNPSVVTISNVNSPTAVFSNFASPGTYLFTWGSSTCFDTILVKVTDKVEAGPLQALNCIVAPGGSIFTAANLPNGNWTISQKPANSSATISGSNGPIANIFNFSDEGFYSFIYTVGTCVDSFTVNVTTIKTAGNDKTASCVNLPGGSVTMNSFDIGMWKEGTNNPGTSLIVDKSANNTIIKDFSKAGVYTYIWSSGSCTDTAKVTVTTIPDVGPNRTVSCINLPGGSEIMAADGAGKWTVVTKPGELEIVDDTNPKTEVKNFTLPGIYVLRWTTSDGCFKDLSITVSQRANAGLDQEVKCQNLPGGLVNMAASGTGQWSVITLLNPPGPTTIVSPLSATTAITGFPLPGKYYYLWTSNGCLDTATVTVLEKTNAGIDQTFNCVALSSLNVALSGNGTIGSWTNLNFGGTLVNPTSPTASVNNYTAAGIFNYEWNINGCRDTVKITVTEKANAGPNPVAIGCYATDQAILNAGSVSTPGLSGNWTALGGNPSTTVQILTPNTPSTIVKGFGLPGIYKFVWTVGSCKDTVEVNAGNVCVCPIDNNVISGGGEYCGQSPILTILGSVATPSLPANTYKWEWSINGGAFNGLPSTTKDLTTTQLGVAEYAYRRIYINNAPPFCQDTSNVILVKVKPFPNAGGDQTLSCVNLSTASVGVIATGSGNWNAINGGSIAEPNNNATTLSTFPSTGTYSFEWLVNGCKDTMKVIVTEEANAGLDKNLECVLFPATSPLSALKSGVWSQFNGNPNVTTITPVNNPSTVVSNITKEGVHKYYWTLPTGCKDSVNILVSAKPNAGPNINKLCSDLPTTANLQATGNGTWNALNGGTVLATVNPTSNVIGLNTAGTYEFEWVNNGCIDTANIVVTEAADAGPDQNIACFVGANISILGNGNGTWTKVLPNSSIETITGNNISATFSSAGNYKFVYTLGLCKDTVTIVVGNDCPCPIINNIIDQPIIQEYCIVSPTIEITGEPATPQGTYTWQYKLNNGSFNLAPGVAVNQYYNTLALPVGTHYFRRIYKTTNAPICFDTSNIVLIKVNAKPNAGADIPLLCQTLPGASINTNAIGNGTWTLIESGPTIVVPSTNNTLITFDQAGSYNFIWTVDNCPDTMKVTVSKKVNAGQDINLNCITLPGVAQLAADGPGTWSVILPSPDVVNLDANDPNTIVSGIDKGGVYRFKWSENGCDDEVKITVSEKSDAGPDVQLNCLDLTTGKGFLNAKDLETGTWRFVLGSGGTPSILFPTNPNAEVSGFQSAGVYIFEWTNNLNCKDTTEVFISEKPNAGQDVTVPCFINQIVNIKAIGNGQWSFIGSIPLTFGDPSLAETTVTGFTSPGQYQIVWTDQVSNCMDTVIINAGNSCPCQIANNSIDAPNPSVFCANSGNIQLIGSDATPAAGTYQWQYSQGTNPFGNATGVSTNKNYFTQNLGVGTHRFRRIYKTTTLPICQDTSDFVVILVESKPSAGVNINKQCIDFQGLTIPLNGNGLSGLWTQLDGTSTLIITGETNPKAVLSNFAADGTYLMQWTVNGCSDSLEIFVSQKANAGIDKKIDCATIPGGQETLSATGTGTWSFVGTGTKPFITNETSAITDVNNFNAAGIYTFVWTTNNNCVDTTKITVTEKADAGTDIPLSCITLPGGSTNLNAKGIKGSGKWTLKSNSDGTADIVDDTDPKTAINNFNNEGQYFFEWKTNDGCTSDVIVVVSKAAEAGNATANVDCYVTGSTLLSANGTGQWKLSSSPNGSTLLIDKPNENVTNVNNFSIDGIYIFTWTATNGCEDIVTVTVGKKCNCPIANKDIIPPPSNYCGSSGILDINGNEATPAGGTYLWQYSFNNPIINSPAPDANSAEDYKTRDLPPGDHRFRRIYTINTPACADTSNEILIKVNTIPTAGTDKMLKCVTLPGGSIPMNAAGSGQWTILTGDANIDKTNLPTTLINDFKSEGEYKFQWEVNGCKDTVAITVTGKPNAGIDKTLDCIALPGSVKMSAIGSGNWFKLGSNNTNIVKSNLETTEINNFDKSGTYQFEWIVTNGCKDTVAVDITSKADAGQDQNVQCYLTGSAVLTASTSIGSWSEVGVNPASSTIQKPNENTTVVDGFGLEGTYNYQWTDDNGCKDTVSIVVGKICSCTIGANNITPVTTIYCEGQPVIVNITGSDATPVSGTYQWETKLGNASFGIPTNVSTNKNYTTLNLGVGVHSFRRIYSILTPTECSDTSNIITITVNEKPNAGADQIANCVNVPGGSVIMQGVGTNGLWTKLSSTNNGNATVSNTNGNATISNFTTLGEYIFEWELNGCADTAKINVLPASNGGPSINVKCFSKDTAIMSASGSGVWTILSGNPGTSILVNASSPNAVIKSFEKAGTYFYVWTSNGCADTVAVIVGAVCLCDISSNTLTPISDTYCSNSGLITIDGSIATPTGGTYQWQTSLAANPFDNVTNGGLTEDYTTLNLGVGIHKFRRIYNILSPVACSDTSNIVTIEVKAKPNAGPDVTVPCFSDDTATLDAVGSGVWTIIPTGNPGTSTLDNSNNKNALVYDFERAGTYKYIWTSNGCTDTVSVIAGTACNCAIDINTLTPITTTYCSNSGLITIDGTIATPAGGTYQWQTSLGTNPFDNVTNGGNSKDYTTLNLGVGTHKFRRIYKILTPVPCSDTSNIVTIEVIAKPNAGTDMVANCVAVPGGNVTMNGVGTNGLWTKLSGGNASIGSNNGNATISNFSVLGQYVFEWSLNGCSDTALVTVNGIPSAGPDAVVKCFSIGIANLAATGSGVWSIVPGVGTSTITDKDKASTTVTGFSQEGNYQYVWTSNGCSDTVNITVGKDCNCAIVSNNLLTPPKVNFCDTAKLVVITGNEAQPLGGTYLWESNFNNTIWKQAEDVFNTKDYTANLLIAGNHKFRRIYSIQGQNPCMDTSNVISIEVNRSPNVGPDLDQICITIPGGLVTIPGSGNDGVWNPNVSNIGTATLSNSASTTTIKDFTFPGIYNYTFVKNGCEDKLQINVTEAANAGVDKDLGCVIFPGGSVFMEGNAGLFAGISKWTAGNNPSITDIVNINEATTEIKNFKKEGIYKFIWSIGSCKDEVTINVTAKIDAGSDDIIQCYKTQTASLSAVSLGGTWSLIPALSEGTAQIANATSANTTVSNFSEDGDYVFVWKVGACSDTVKISALANCSGCAINQNNINTPDGSFCTSSQNLVIDGTEANPSGGTYLWQYNKNSTSWVNADPINTNEDYIASNLPIGKHQFRRIYILSASCIDTSLVTTINIITKPSAPTILAPITLCEGEKLKLNTKDSIGYAFQWTGPNFTSTIFNPTIDNVKVANSGNYKLILKLADCESDTATINIKVNPAPAKPVVIAPAASCESIAAKIIGPTITGASYQWIGPSGKTYTTKDIDFPSVSVLDTGKYTLTISVNGCSSLPTSTNLVVNKKPIANISSAQVKYCEGDLVLISTPLKPLETYKWIGPMTSSTNEIKIDKVEKKDEGAYKLVISKQGCESDTAVYTLIVNVKPTALPLVNNGPLCEGSPLTIKADQIPGIKYQWIGPKGNISNSTNTVSINSAVATDNGKYKLIISDDNNCKSDTAETTVVIKKKPSLAASQLLIKCFETDTATITVTDVETGTWKAITSGVVIANPNNKTTKVYGFKNEGIYVFEWNNGVCIETITLSVGQDCPCKLTENEISQPVPSTFCSEGDDITIIGTESTNSELTYLWQISKDGSPFTSATIPYDKSNYSTGKLGIGSYEFRRILKNDLVINCTDTSEIVTINIVDKTKFNIELEDFDNPSCIGDSILISIKNPLSNANYIWSSEESLTLIGKKDSTTTVILSGNASGTHKIFVRLNEKGCEDIIPSSTEVVINKNPYINLGSDTTFCSLDGEYQLNADGFESVVWNDGSDGNEFIVKEKGLYSVVVTDTLGCKSTDEIRIKEFCCKVFAPNIILIQQGSINSEFKVTDNGCVLTSKIRIYDRWGNLVYVGLDGQKPWDATFNGTPVEQGVYVFIFEYTALDEDDKEFKGKLSGDITVIRKL
jgi:gliding motility-associated-like protein